MDGLSVRVEPAEAGFFAGENLNVRISLRNDRTGLHPSVPDPSSSSLSVNHARQSTLDLQADALADAFKFNNGLHHTSDESSAGSTISPLFPGSRPRPPPGHEQVIWAYAQLSGTFSIDPALIKPFDFELVKQLIANGALHADTPAHGRAIGGGELIPESMARATDDDPADPEPVLATAAHQSMDSLVLGLGLPTPLERTTQDDKLYAKLTGQRPPRRVRSVSVAHLGGFPSLNERKSDGWTTYLRNRLTLNTEAPKALPAGSEGDWARIPQAHRRTGSTLADKAAETVLAREIPTLSMPPSVLCVDLTLAPGQEESFDLTLPLPPDLPPSYIGRAISFTYALSIGVNRSQPGSSRAQRNRIVQIPMRVFTHVSNVGEPPFWDLLNPIIWLTDHGAVKPVASHSEPLVRPPPKTETRVTRQDLEHYARLLLSSTEPATEQIRRTLERQEAEDDDYGPKTCLEHADLLTRNSPKVSYDIAKDGQIAAILTLTQSKYRLGDTIRGVLTINQAEAGTRIVRAKVQLDCYEEIQPDVRRLDTAQSARLTTRTIECTEESLTDLGQWSWELTVPPTLAPSFHTSALTFKYNIKLSLLTLACVKPVYNVPTVLPNARGGGARSRNASTDDGHPSGVPLRTPIKPTPPPHLVPSASDGFGAYHERLQAVPSYVGTYPFSLPSAEPERVGLLGNWRAPQTHDDERVTAEPFDRWLEAHHAGRETKLEIVECSVPLAVLPSRAQYSVSNISFAA